MKKICATILSIAMLLAVTGVMTVGAEGEETYTYERNEDIISEVIYQDFEDLDSMDDYTTKHEAAPGENLYGFFSHVSGGGSVMITNDTPIEGEQSIRFKDLLDARRWTIDQQVEFDADAYVMEFKIRLDNMASDGKFTIKLTDVNSPEKDSENSANPILSFKNVADKIGLYDLGDKLVSELEANKVYSVAVVCETLSQNYYVFLDGKFMEKAEFNVEFSALSAFRFDLSGTGTVITMDDILVDGCEIKKGGSAEGTPTAEATEVPTKEPSTATASGTSATPTPKPAPATSTNNPSNEDGGFPTWAIIAIAAGAVVIIAAVVVIVVKKKKK